MKSKTLLFGFLATTLMLSTAVMAAIDDPRPGAAHASSAAKEIVGDDLIARCDNCSGFGPGLSWLYNLSENANNDGQGTAPACGGTLFGWQHCCHLPS